MWNGTLVPYRRVGQIRTRGARILIVSEGVTNMRSRKPEYTLCRTGPGGVGVNSWLHIYRYKDKEINRHVCYSQTLSTERNLEQQHFKHFSSENN